LAEINQWLQSATLVGPAPGFGERFATRLAAHHQRQQRQQAIGQLILILAGIGTLGWMFAPWAMRFLDDPAAHLTALIASLLSLWELIEALVRLGSIVLHLVPVSFQSALGIALGGLSAISLLWLKHFAHSTKGS